MQRFINAKAGFAIVMGAILTYLYMSLFSHTLFSGGRGVVMMKVTLLLGQIWSSVFLIFGCIIAAEHKRSHFSKIFFLVIIAIILLMMILDALALSLFGMKFSPLRFSEFLSWDTIGTSTTQSTGNSSIVSIIAIMIIISYAVFRGSIDFSRLKPHKTIIILICCTILSYASGQTLYSLSGPSVGQLFLNPLFVTVDDIRHYETTNDNRTGGSDIDMQGYYNQLNGYDKKRNVILVFAESFSVENSKRNGGISDSMPQFDRIEKDGMTLTHYMAPGCVSEHAHTSLLQGIFPLRYGDLFTSDGYEAFSADHDPLATFFANEGYETAFISAVSLDFLHQRDFIKKVGYQTIIDENAFTGSQKYVFESSPDRDLYTKTIDVVKDYQLGSKPFFVTLQTISSHLGWQTPYGNTKEDAIRYADDEIGIFYDHLRQTKFFDNGILVIVSDHRMPTTLDQATIEKLGPTRPSRVVATIVGTGILPDTINDNMYQAIDLHFGLKQLISKESVTSFSFINNPFDNLIRRQRGLYYCKYRDNTIWTIQNDMMTPLEKADQAIQDLVSTYQGYQFRRNIIEKNSPLSGTTHTGIVTTPWKEKNFLLIGHGGAPAYAPYNSLSGMLLALAQGADGVELDLSYTADNINLVSHGPHAQLERDGGIEKCHQRYTIATTKFNTIWKDCPLANGEKMMDFDEFLRLTKDIVPLYVVEIKVYDTDKGVQQMYDAIATAKKYGVDHKIIRVSYDTAVRKLLTMQEGIIVGRDMFDINEYGGKLFEDFSYSMMPLDQVEHPEILAKLRQFGKPIISYTPLTSGEIAKVYRLGIDGMLVDDIPLAKKTIDTLSKK